MLLWEIIQVATTLKIWVHSFHQADQNSLTQILPTLFVKLSDKDIVTLCPLTVDDATKHLLVTAHYKTHHFVIELTFVICMAIWYGPSRYFCPAGDW